VEKFVKNIKDSEKPFDEHLRECALIQFQQNMKEAKKVVAQWDKDKIWKDDRLLKEAEEGLETLYNSEGFGYSTTTQQLEAKQLEEKKRNTSLEKEKEWSVKSRVIWLQLGNESSKFFHRYAKGRKNINSL